jgi:hypothetical protein
MDRAPIILTMRADKPTSVTRAFVSLFDLVLLVENLGRLGNVLSTVSDHLREAQCRYSYRAVQILQMDRLDLHDVRGLNRGDLNSDTT